MCSLGIDPPTFALLTQCSTTEPQEHCAVTVGACTPCSRLPVEGVSLILGNELAGGKVPRPIVTHRPSIELLDRSTQLFTAFPACVVTRAHTRTLHIRVYYLYLLSTITVLHILSHCTSYSFYFIICSLFHSHLYLYIYILLCYVSLFYCLFYFLFYYYYYYYYYYIYIFCFFALSIERTCPDLHFTTDYTLYDCVCDK